MNRSGVTPTFQSARAGWKTGVTPVLPPQPGAHGVTRPTRAPQDGSKLLCRSTRATPAGSYQPHTSRPGVSSGRFSAITINSKSSGVGGRFWKLPTVHPHTRQRSIPRQCMYQVSSEGR